MQHGRVNVAEVVRRFDSSKADVVGGSNDGPPLNASAGHEHREPKIVMVATVALSFGRPSEFAAP